MPLTLGSTDNLLHFSECLWSILLFAVFLGLFDAIILKLLKMLINRVEWDYTTDDNLVRMNEEIAQIQRRMSLLSPTVEFAQYFKLERILNRLLDERNKLVGPQLNGYTSLMSWKILISLKMIAFILSLGLAIHSARDTTLISLSPNYFYPFNFLLNLPISIVYFTWASDVDEFEQPVSFFSISLLLLFMLKLCIQIWKESSKKIK